MVSKHRKLSLLIIAAFAVTILFRLTDQTDAQSGFTPPFHPNSIWNRPIGSSPSVNPNSAQMITNLVGAAGGHMNIDGITGAWSVPVYYAPPGTPLQQVCDAARYRPCEMVPVPAGLRPSPDADAKTVIVDLGSNPQRAWSFWLFTKGDGSNGDWTAGWGAFGWGNITSSGDGIRNYDGGEWGGRVAGWNYYAGLIHPEEIQQGRIDHALAFFIPQWVASNNYVWPARGSDGNGGTGSNVIPVGARLQLDPSVNVNALPLSAGAKVIARAMQTYGGWVADTGVAVAVDAREFVAVDANGNAYVDSSPWAGLLSSMDLRNFPIDKLRVIQVNSADFYQEGINPTPTATNPSQATNTPTRTPSRTPTRTPSPTATPVGSSLPVSYLTVYDAMDSVSSNWTGNGSWNQGSHSAYRGTGLGWRANSTTKSVLKWNRQLDLRNVPNAYLWFQSRLTYTNTAALSPARVQVSVDGVNWKNVAYVTQSTEWKVPSINLSAYVGQRIQLRFMWATAQAGDMWRFDDMTIGSLAQGAAAAGFEELPLVDGPVENDNDPSGDVPVDPPADVPVDVPVDVVPTEAPRRQLDAPADVAPINPAPTQPPTGNTGLSVLESDSTSIIAASVWTPMTQPAGASGGSYLINADPTGTLTLGFEGSSVVVAFVQGPSFGQFAIEIDGAVQQVVNANAADYQFGQAVINGLNAGAHALRIVPQAGVVAIDAFLVSSALAPMSAPNSDAPITAFDPANAEPGALPTADTRFPTLDAPLGPDVPANPPADVPVATVAPTQAPDVPPAPVDPPTEQPLPPPEQSPIAPDGDGPPISLGR